MHWAVACSPTYKKTELKIIFSQPKKVQDWLFLFFISNCLKFRLWTIVAVSIIPIIMIQMLNQQSLDRSFVISICIFHFHGGLIDFTPVRSEKIKKLNQI